MAATESYPAELKYHREHDWARVDGDEAVLGITWFAQDSLGELVHYEAPDEGSVRMLEVGGHHQIHAVQFRFRKLDPGVDDDHVSAELDERRVLADLAHAAHRADAYSLVDRHTCG